MRFGRRRIRTIAIATLAVLVVGLGVGQAFRDDVPPQLWSESPERVAAGEPFSLFVSADEPATFRIRYGAVVVDRVDQRFTLDLEGQEGPLEIVIEAEDAAGNRAERRVRVIGEAVPVASLELPERVTAGTPYAAVVRVAPEGARVVELEVDADGASRPLHELPSATLDGRWTLFAAPLSVDPGETVVTVRWQDVFGRTTSRSTRLAIDPLVDEVQELRIPASTLAVITPEGRELEATVLADAAPDSADAPRWSEPFVLPVEGRATSGFARARRYAAGGPVSFHEGEDIAAPTGTPIRATNDGLVVVAGMFPIKGGLTVIDHGAGVTSRYFHQSRIDVEVGQTVARGDVIGAVGTTGLSTGPHLHWEMRVDDVASDPLAWVDRMLP